MDTKNDDSAGSDSLDKSLQMKCVVDDAGDGILQPTESISEPVPPSNRSSGVSGFGQNTEGDSPTKKHKAETAVGDGADGGEKEQSVCLSDVEDGKNYETKLKVLTPSEDIHKNDNTTTNPSTSSTIESDPTPPECSSIANYTDPSTGKAFETKVKQISRNLKETTLADAAANLDDESATSLCKKISLEDTSSSSSTSNSCEYDPTTLTVVEKREDEEKASTSRASTSTSTYSLPTGQQASISSSSITEQEPPQPDDAELETSLCSSEANDDDESSFNQRSKKVRFHPDVKENDGGNRVIPKKKKKMRATACEEAQFSAARLDFEMDLDEDDDDEEEEEFDLAKTIAEAQDYLKLHPLTFARPLEKGGSRLQNGLLEEEDLRTLSESSEEEDFYEKSEPENGVERILGKHIKGGKVEFLLRYAERPGLFWATEDFILKQCPSLLSQYEQNRERRQERLMHHVAKRQNIRQRYTDF